MTPRDFLRQHRQETPPFSVLKWALICLPSCPQFDLRQQDKCRAFCLVHWSAPTGTGNRKNDPLRFPATGAP